MTRAFSRGCNRRVTSARGHYPHWVCDAKWLPMASSHCPSTMAVPASYFRQLLPDRGLEAERALRVSALVQELPGGYVGVIFTVMKITTSRARTFPVQRP